MYPNWLKLLTNDNEMLLLSLSAHSNYIGDFGLKSIKSFQVHPSLTNNFDNFTFVLEELLYNVEIYYPDLVF